jgi:membrane fusion protein
MASAAQVPAPAVKQRASPAPDHQPLFRPEVVAERQTQWLGTVLLEPRISQSIFTSIATLAGIAVLALMLFGSYTSKAHINGWLVPQQGLARIVAPQSGVVTRIQVQEGMSVTKGMPLLTLSAEIHSEALGAAKEEVARQVLNRRENLVKTKSVLKGQLDQEAIDLGQRLEIQRSRVKLSETTLARYRGLLAVKLMALPRVEQAEQEFLDNQAAALALEAKMRELPFKRQTQLAEVDRNIAVAEQELAEAEARREIVITAPQDGTVTAIQAEPGSSAQPNVPLMSIVPTSTVLQAQLFAPSRAVGFVHPGQRVLLRYQAYPYQKYGSYVGMVSSVSRTAISPSEMTQQLFGLTSLHAVNEPLYRITVALERQTATAYGQAIALQPGMQLEADVMIETRSLIEWVFDPLFTLTGKWRA